MSVCRGNMNNLIKNWFLIYVCVLIQVAAEHNCNELGTLLYEELGCKPEYELAQACPSYYSKCKYSRPKDKCTFQNVIYKLGDIIDHSLTNCDINCFCHQREQTSIPSFTCAVLDCPEFFGRPPLGKDCYRTYELGRCCAVGQICPPFDKNAVCKMDGITYREGQRFHPKKTCLECVCQKGFRGEYVEPFCRKRSCAFELRHVDALEKSCAPVYYVEEDDKALCCPHDFICPTDSEKIIKKVTKLSTTTEKCRFGEHTLGIGDYMERNHLQYGKTRNLICSCVLPPYVTCVGNF